MRARHRVSKLLLRYGRVYPKDRGTWTVAHRDWLAAQRFDEPALELAYLDALASVDGLMARRSVLEQHLSRLATTPELWPTVARLRAFRGIDTLTALGLVTEIGDFQRFARARPVGLARARTEHPPKRREHQPGWDHEDRIAACPPAARRGCLALPAPPHASGRTLRNRRDGQPAEILQIAWRAQHRLYRTHTRLRERGKHGNLATVAAARELAGFVWAAATA
jgi:hypothetical protein